MSEQEILELTAEEIWGEIYEGYLSREDLVKWVANQRKEAIELQNL